MTSCTTGSAVSTTHSWTPNRRIGWRVATRCKALCCGAVLISLIGGTGHARVWTDSTGKFTVEADLIQCDDESVVLRKPSGEEIEVSLLRLSAVDRAFLKSRYSYRTWMIDDRSLIARVRKVTASRVVLQQPNGKGRTVSLSALTEYDRTFVKDAFPPGEQIDKSASTPTTVRTNTYRTWRHAFGDVMEAKLKTTPTENVRLEGRDGKGVTVPVYLLSEGDVTYLAARYPHLAGREAEFAKKRRAAVKRRDAALAAAEKRRKEVLARAEEEEREWKEKHSWFFGSAVADPGRLARESEAYLEQDESTRVIKPLDGSSWRFRITADVRFRKAGRYVVRGGFVNADGKFYNQVFEDSFEDRTIRIESPKSKTVELEMRFVSNGEYTVKIYRISD